MTVPAVLPCLGGRDGVSTAPRALYQPHRLYISPMGFMSAPQTLYQPHRLYISPTGSMAAYQPHVAACHVTVPGFLPSTLPRRLLSHFSPAVTWSRQVV